MIARRAPYIVLVAASLTGCGEKTPQSPSEDLRRAVGAGDASAVREKARIVTVGTVDALTALTAGLDATSPEIREVSAKELAVCIAASDAGRARLISLLESSDEGTLTDGAKLFARVGSPAVGLLSSALSSPHPSVRARAAWALGAMRPPGAAAIGELAKLLGDSSVEVRRRAAFSIEAITSVAEGSTLDPGLLERLGTALGDAEPQVRASAAGSLGSVGVSAGRYVPQLAVVAQRDSVPAVRRAAVRALAQIAPASAEARAAFASAANDSSQEVQAAAQDALRQSSGGN